MSAARDFRSLASGGTIHFMGVGGAGMCALAEDVLRAGGRVGGCDLRPGRAGERLTELGAAVTEGHDPSHVQGIDVLVVSAAVPPDHPEIRAARDAGIPVLKRARALGEWVAQGTVVGVAGTHGKTTTTAMTTLVLEEIGLDPTGFVGGTVPGWNGNLRPGGREVFVVEADEYDRSFHALAPVVAVVTNLEADHLDVYGDLQGVRDAFRTFLGAVPERGRVIACGDDAGASRLLSDVGDRALSYGLNPGLQLRAVDLRFDEGGSRFRVLEDGVIRGEAVLAAPGVHNVRNALAAVAVGRFFGGEWDAILRGLAAYRGVGRRFDVLDTVGGVTVVDDYAHHPTEVRATLAAARTARPEARLVAVFQPHLFSRTRDFHRELGEALAEADRVWVTDVYPAREEPLPGVTGELVAEGARRAGAPAVRYHAELEGLAGAVAESLEAGDLCVILGAGSIEAVGPGIVAELRDRTGGGDDGVPADGGARGEGSAERDAAGGSRKHA